MTQGKGIAKYWDNNCDSKHTLATSKGWTGSTEQCLVSYMETEESDSVFTCKVFKSASLPSIYDPKQDERIINVTTDGAPVHQQVHQAVEYSMVTSVVNQATSVHHHQQQQQHHVWFSEHAARGTPISPDEITRCAKSTHFQSNSHQECCILRLRALGGHCAFIPKSSSIV